MPKINLLPKQVAELIAAGEVVERPASVIKELIENSIDAEADDITVEIQHGGITYIRITDNGCGIAREDVPTAFLRHATSKIKTGVDLGSIATLGFRGEALAAVSSVSRVEMFTRVKEEDFGTHYKIEGGEEVLNEETGCPTGTTIIIRDLFYNTPARMKFLKKDVSEANAAAAVADRIALSHPEIAFKLIRDGKLDRITVKGLTCKPISCRPTRNYQFLFLNGRLVRSGTVSAAAEQAYKNSAMIGKFPGFVLYLTVPFDTVDVNVHPAKTEVRFSDEKRIFDAVYHAVKTAISKGDTRPEIKLKQPVFNPFERLKTEEYRQQTIEKPTVAEKIYSESISLHKSFVPPAFSSPEKPQVIYDNTPKEPIEPPVIPEDKPAVKERVSVDIIREEPEEKPEIRIIGEAFSTYIIAETGSSIYMIDKHAAHERILFNELKKRQSSEVQALLTPVTVTLTPEEYGAVTQNTEILSKAGFEIEDFGNTSVRVYAVPATLTKEDTEALVSELAGSLLKTSRPEIERLEDIYHTVACRAAIKAGNKLSPLEMKKLAERVLGSDDVMYCPHGRPVAFEIKRRELEKQFGRIQ